MKRFLKRVTAILLCLVLSCSLLPVTGLAASHPFQDVPSSHWANSAVAYVYDNNLMNGTGSNTFTPNGTLTRAMFVTILGRMDGVNTASYPGTSFSDVPTGQWYSPYVAWASSQGIVTGTGNGRFSPNSPVTREQMAAMIARYVEASGIHLPDADNPASSFKDAASVSSWARDGLELMRRTGILSGYADGTFGPKKTATRAEAAAIFMRLCVLLDGGTPEEPPVKENVYQEVLNQYKQARAYGFDIDFIENSGLSYVNTYAEYISFSTNSTTIYYALEDIDNNGTDELIIGVSESGDIDPFILDIFTCNGNYVVNPFNCKASSYMFSARNSIRILSAGVLVNAGSGGAAYNAEDYYILSENGYEARLIEGIYSEPTQYNYDDVRFYHVTGNGYTTEITMKEYYQISESYNLAEMNLHWTVL